MRGLGIACALLLAVGCGGGGGGGGGGAGVVDAPAFAGEEIVFRQTERVGFDGLTRWIGFRVPSDAISLTVEAVTSDGFTEIGVQDLRGPAGRAYIVDRDGPMRVRKGFEVVSVTVPNTDDPDLGLLPGDYQLRVYSIDPPGDEVDVRVIVERRPAAANVSGKLDLNVWLADGLPISSTTAAGDARLQGVIDSLFSVLAQAGVQVTRGDVEYYDIIDPAFDSITSSELPALLRLSRGALEVRLNLFFLLEVLGGGVVGASPTVSGPKRNGTRFSGVAVDYDGVTFYRDPATIGDIAAHEIGHYLGLFHTVEEDGEHDPILDTPECPAVGAGGQCAVAGGNLLMHWQYFGGQILTPGQGLVIRGHPVISSRDE